MYWIKRRANNNGIILKDFCTFNNLKISNTFFIHKNIHKYTWEAKGTKSTIDYIIINNKLNDNIKDTRVFRGSEIDSDDMLVESRLEFTKRNTYNKRKKEKESIINKHFKIHLLEQESIRNLYKNRVKNKIKPVTNNTETYWENIKETVLKAAEESIGYKSRKKIKNALELGVMI
jgi:hypothetical protein